MTNAINKTTFTYPSSNGEHAIHVINWYAEEGDSIKGVLQIAHGMAEHAGRYDDFARFMVQQGFVVYANDHAGHGCSVNEQKNYGYFGKEEGRAHLVQDMYQLTLIAKEKYPDKPFFLLGHSMGSFLSRKYTALHGPELTGVIYMGTGNGSPLTGVAIVLAGLMVKLKGAKAPGRLLDKLAFGNFNDHISSVKTPFDWLSADHENVKQYMDDKLNGFMFTNSAFLELFSVIHEVTNKDWAAQLPKNLPVLLVSGKEDPVGGYGKGVIKTEQLLLHAGMTDVTLRLYSGMRHEILNEKDKKLVYRYIYEWLNRHLEHR